MLCAFWDWTRSFELTWDHPPNWIRSAIVIWNRQNCCSRSQRIRILSSFSSTIPILALYRFEHSSQFIQIHSCSRLMCEKKMKTCCRRVSPLISHLISLRGLRCWCPAFRLCCGAGRLCSLLHPGDVRCAAGRSFMIKAVKNEKNMKTYGKNYILGSATFISDITPL